MLFIVMFVILSILQWLVSFEMAVITGLALIASDIAELN